MVQELEQVEGTAEADGKIRKVVPLGDDSGWHYLECGRLVREIEGNRKSLTTGTETSYRAVQIVPILRKVYNT